MRKPDLSPAARADFRLIRIYSKAAFGAATALAYVEALRSTIHMIGTNPLTGRREIDLGNDIRSFPCRSHRIYYRVDRRAVLIVRILHHAQDSVSAFGPRH